MNWLQKISKTSSWVSADPRCYMICADSNVEHMLENLIREAVKQVGIHDRQKIFDYIAPKLREKGLNPDKWIPWIFDKIL